MSGTATLVRQKLDQAVEILREQDVDLWLTFVRETSLTSDPSLGLIAGVYSAWQGAFLVSATGERIAIVGRFDAPSVEQIGAYEVIGYDESIRPALRKTVERLAPRTIALNYSESDPAADGLTHGLWRVLQDTFTDTYADRFVPSEAIVNALRGRKSPEEVERIRGATRETEEIFWTRSGELLHVDFGVSRNDYCSDLQRVWYFSDHGATDAPEDVRHAWDALWASVDAGVAALRPGVAGWEVDAAARESLVAAGYPEPMYALGHQLGRSAHDGGTVLAPRWDRYGTAPFGVVEERNVFTLEYGTAVPGRGYIGLEEDVLVTADGIEWLSTPQREIWIV